MRPGQNRRMRGRNRKPGPNPLTRSYESNGPDVKIRGTAQHIADKYAQLARDAQSSGDPVAAENYLQHAEHYYRLIAAAQEQLRQQYGGYDEDGDEDGQPGQGFGDRALANGGDEDFGSQPQPFDPSDRQQRFDGADRQPRFDRQDRGDRQDQRQDRPDRFDRGEGRDRFPRQDRPHRQDRQDRPQRQEYQPRENGEYRPDYNRDQPRQDQGRQDQPRQDQPRGDRPEFRQDRQDRPERGQRREGEFRRGRPPRDEARDDAPEFASALPAFLTNPVRAPVATDELVEPAAPAPAEAPEAVNGAPEGEATPLRARRRRRTRAAAPDGADGFLPDDAATPAAE